jgi:hypothetical protein
VSKNERVRNVEPLEGVFNEFSLKIRRPDQVARAVTVAETRTVYNNDTVVLGSEIDQTARFEVLDHAAVAVQENERFAGTSFDIVQPNTLDVEEAASGRVLARWRLSKAMVANAPIITAEATANEGASALRRRAGIGERRRLTTWAAVMYFTRESACTRSRIFWEMLQRHVNR